MWYRYLALFILSIAVLVSPVLSQEPEEDPDWKAPSDEVVEGVLKEHSPEVIIIEDEEFRLCPQWYLYSPEGLYIYRDMLKNADRIKAFVDIDRGCVRKIKILEYLQ